MFTTDISTIASVLSNMWFHINIYDTWNKIKQPQLKNVLQCLSLSGVSSLRGFLSWRIPPLVLHVGLHRPPQSPDVSLAKARCPSSLDQLEEEGVLCEDGLGEHLEEVSRDRQWQHGVQQHGTEWISGWKTPVVIALYCLLPSVFTRCF